jgi:nanoRNase/pAp phosphatase (c-di-AMP/oligoRNAs hydrolase)
VVERVELYNSHRDLFIAQVERCTTTYGKLALIDLRDEEVIYSGNRFMIYALFPHCDISAHVIWGVKKQNTVFAIGKSILDRGSPVDVGAVCLSYGGGGHRAAGTCQVANDRVDIVKAELIAAISAAQSKAAA